MTTEIVNNNCPECGEIIDVDYNNPWDMIGDQVLCRGCNTHLELFEEGAYMDDVTIPLFYWEEAK